MGTPQVKAARSIARKRARYQRALDLACSYTRMPAAIKLIVRCGLPDREALKLLGDVWSICDNIGRCKDLLEIMLPDEPSRSMMSTTEWKALQALPENVTIYRGAGKGVNEHGLSWTLDRVIAARFPFFMRYRAQHPVLVTATVRRDQITALKLCRKESEVITRFAVVTAIEDVRYEDAFTEEERSKGKVYPVGGGEVASHAS